MSRDTKTFKHESYGMVGFHRVTGGIGRLFGSSIDKHHTAVRLRINRGVREHHLGRDWYYAKEEIIEVEISAAQFAELLTTMNVGSGIPCTIRHLNCKSVENPPDEQMEVEEIRDAFENDTKTLVKDMKAYVARITEVLGASKPPGKKEREELLSQLRLFVQRVESDMPFMVDQFAKASEKISSSIKAEVDAFLTHNILIEGIRSLTEKAQNQAPPQLEAKISEEDK